jgi:hypothetical protein
LDISKAEYGTTAAAAAEGEVGRTDADLEQNRVDELVLADGCQEVTVAG